MQRSFFLTLSVFLLITFISCNSTKDISGTYRSKFAVLGFFGTRVVLNSDSSFTYRIRGDVSYDTAAGQYTIQRKFLILNYRPLISDSTQDSFSGEASLYIHEAITGNKNLHEPSMYLIGHNKLFLTDSLGNKVRTQWGYSRFKRYLLFGKRWYYRRYYLKRVD